jgi:glycoside/pentoside/hexuronide:cation symporter, GPH family
MTAHVMPDATPSPRLPLRDALRYGALGAPLAFVALPLYVHWPAYAAPATGLSLATLGGLLLVVRCFDAFVDPWLGARADALLARGGAGIAGAMALGCAALIVGFAALFIAPSSASMPFTPASPAGWVAWSIASLAITYLGYSFVSIAHQAWGARLGGNEGFRARVVASRESFALAGVVAASVLPTVAGWGTVSLVMSVCLVLGVALLLCAPAAAGAAKSAQRNLAGASSGSWARLQAPLRHAEFRALLFVHALSALSAAVPATLVLFFIRDRLVLPGHEGLFLLAYFAAAALSVPIWTRVVERIGLVRVWAAGMVLAIAVFAFAAWLSQGDALGYALVCVGSGAALGAKLVAPAALLAGAIGRTEGALQDEGLWFGWWNLVSKLALALAAGLALPLVQVLGYRQGDASSVAGLVVVYALVPCVLEALALAALMARRWTREAPKASPAAGASS